MGASCTEPSPIDNFKVICSLYGYLDLHSYNKYYNKIFYSCLLEFLQFLCMHIISWLLSMFTVFLFSQRKRAIYSRRMCWDGYSMAIMSDHRSTTESEIPLGKCYVKHRQGGISGHREHKGLKLPLLRHIFFYKSHVSLQQFSPGAIVDLGICIHYLSNTWGAGWTWNTAHCSNKVPFIVNFRIEMTWNLNDNDLEFEKIPGTLKFSNLK